MTTWQIIMVVTIVVAIVLANLLGYFLNDYKFEIYRFIRIRTRKQKKLMNYINDADKTCKLKLEKYKNGW